MAADVSVYSGATAADGLGGLAQRAGFDRFHDTVATALADRYTLKVHTDIGARRRAHAEWIGHLVRSNGSAMDHRRFVGTCAELIASLARYRIVTFSAMIRDVSDPMTDVVLEYGNEVTALAAGATVYALPVGALTGSDPGEPLSPMVVENAASLLRRQPEEAALRFRELLRLTTPWS